jgi:hypothetical protein
MADHTELPMEETTTESHKPGEAQDEATRQVVYEGEETETTEQQDDDE